MTSPRARCGLLEVREVRRQDEERLDQRQRAAPGSRRSGCCRRTCPNMPGTNNSGANAMQRRQDREDDRHRHLAHALDGAPHRAAARRCDACRPPRRPRSRRRRRCPSVTMNANSEIMLIDTSVAGRNSIAPRNEIGMPRVTQNASRISRNSPRQSSTSIRPEVGVAHQQIDAVAVDLGAVVPRREVHARRAASPWCSSM